MQDQANFFSRLRQRNVFRIGTMYVVGSWLLLQFGEIMIEIMELPLWIGRALVVILALGFPFVLLLAWVFDASNQGAITANGDSPAENSGKRIDTAIIIVLATALGTTFVFYDRDSPNTNAARSDAEIAQQQPTRKPAMAPSAASNYLLIGNLVDFTGATGRSGQAWGQAIIDSANWVNENGGVAGKLFDLDTIETSYIVR
ncbi:MAG TPA: hypothetical protein DDW59_02010, partial [Gammaproteobacteria bacterium]|nr:hypothetical protein [Gammaproteobacteria bacterium]